ncbi:MAG: hypothetical protein WA854_02840 [Candidatus Binataceae bacterium]
MHNRGVKDSFRKRFAAGVALAGAVAMLAATGCAPSALTSARARMKAGDYAGARPELVALSAHPENLSAAELREVKDDLCTTDFTIGAPSFPLAEQQQACSLAAAEPGSNSEPLLDRINSAIAQNDANRVEHALKSGDLAGAESAAEDYEATPGASRTQVEQWSGQMWKLVNVSRTHPNRATKTALKGAISELQRENSHAGRMSDDKFRDWVIQTATVAGTPMVEEPKIGDNGILRLAISEGSLPIAALHLDRFATINDGLAARCGCDARTDIGLGRSALPAYVARLDPENRRSEVLILISGASIAPRISSR